MATLEAMLQKVALIEATEDSAERDAQYNALAAMLAAAAPPKSEAAASTVDVSEAAAASATAAPATLRDGT